MRGDVLLVHVRAGRVGPGSWVYAWRRLSDARVVYVGATGMHPAARAWAHLRDENPDIARIRARLPGAGDERFDIVALALPEDVSRANVRDGAAARLREAGLLSSEYVGEPGGDVAGPVPEVVDRLVAAVEEHVRSLGVP